MNDPKEHTRETALEVLYSRLAEPLQALHEIGFELLEVIIQWQQLFPEDQSWHAIIEPIKDKNDETK